MILGKSLLQWPEPDGARLFLLGLSGGLRRLFVSALIAEGVPVVLIMCAIWAFALISGAHVMQFRQALLLFIGLGAGVAILQCTLFFIGSRIRISTIYIYIGARRWRNRSISRYAWEIHEIGGIDHNVLTLTLARAGVIRVALPLTFSRDEMERILSSAGVPK